ncbi:hypothetical protein DFJ74DRAFT_673761 [Hyaloraphidium curvatum]|nr:hypothetical protein DFJ74DRAFT_673761 [Hyaloraphidium curvatum]
MLMFNTYSKLEDLREEIGAAPARFCFGFPAILAKLVDGVLVRKLYPGMASIVSEGPYDSVFTAAGITTAVEPRMQSWLRTHAALVVPLMFLGQLTKRENRSVAYSDAWTAALAMHECFALARRVGEEIVPSGIAVLSWTPTFALAGMLWALGRTGEFKEVQLVGPAEPEALLKEMIAASGGDEGALKALLSLRSP